MEFQYSHRSWVYDRLHPRRRGLKQSFTNGVDDRAKCTQEAFEEKMTQIKSYPNPPADEKEEQKIGLHIWMDVSGGKNKGRLYGAGDLAEFIRSGIDSLDTRGASTYHRCPDDPIINDLKLRLSASEEREQRLENALVEMQMTQQEMMRMLLQQQQAQTSQHPSAQPDQQQQQSARCGQQLPEVEGESDSFDEAMRSSYHDY